MAEINYTNALAQQQQRDQDAERERQNEVEWGKILSEYPLVNHAANRQEVYDWCHAGPLSLLHGEESRRDEP
jgi:hypothetical protein